MGELAFPSHGHTINASGSLDIDYVVTPGMTLRDYFAAKALQGMLANPNRDYSFAGAAIDAYDWADAMMQARLRNGGKDESTSAG